MKKLVKVTLAAVTLLLLNQVVSAQQMPKQGTTTYVTYYISRTLANMDMGEVGSEALVELAGVTRNTNGQNFFDNMAARIIFYRETISGKYRAIGARIETDNDGDKVFTTLDSRTMTHTITGGTGKYKGISGTVIYAVKMLPAPGEGLGALITEHKITWQFK